MSRQRRVLFAGTTAAVVVLLGVGVAIAAWLISGNGSGSAKAGVAGGLNVTPGTGTVTADLYPGTNGGTVSVNVENTNDFPVTLSAATIADGSITPANCLVTVNTGPFTLTGPTIDPHSTQQVQIANALSMGLAADNSCQNADFTIPEVTVSGAAG